MNRSIRGKWPVQHELCHFKRSGLNVISPSTSSGLTGIFLLWLIILSNHFTQPPWHRSQGSNHSKGNSQSSHRGWQVLQKREKKKGKPRKQLRARSESRCTWGTEVFQGTQHPCKGVFPIRRAEWGLSLERSLCRVLFALRVWKRPKPHPTRSQKVLFSPHLMPERDFQAGCRQPETHLTHFQSSVKAKLRTSAFFFCTKISDQEPQKTLYQMETVILVLGRTQATKAFTCLLIPE